MEELTLINTLDEKDTVENLYKDKEITYIFEIYYQRVYNYIYYRVNCSYTAEDLASQVFEKVMLKINTYSESKSPFEIWLFAIARNVVKDYYKSLKNRRLFSLDSIKELVSRGRTPESTVLISEANDELSMALNILNKRERNIVALKFGANLKNKEIAEILDISESNVGVILYRTMRKLKKEMEREE